MNAGSPRVRGLWRALALTFAVAVVTIRLGMAGCGSTAPNATSAGGSASKPTASGPPPKAPVRDPAYMAPTKAGGGYFAPLGTPPAPEPQKQEAVQQMPSPR